MPISALISFFAGMFTVKRLELVQFRNYNSQQFHFTGNIVGICGANGTGKTNLLDALYYLCFTKSYFSKSDSQNVYHNKLGFRLQGEVTKQSIAYTLTCILRENNRKEFSENDIAYKKFSEHIGKYPCVVIAPDDILLITGASEERRVFIDTILSQTNQLYLRSLIDYNKILAQRNGFLKTAADNVKLDMAVLDILDEQLAEKGIIIFELRQSFLDDFLPLALQQYEQIAGKQELLSLVYHTQLNRIPFLQLLKENRSRDFYLQRTGAGIHKDDVELQLNGESFKNTSSQGQRKSLLFALKLAEFQFLKSKKGFSPLLLLDDAFEKLDEQRMNNLLIQVCNEKNGQVFITDTHKERLQKHLSSLKMNFQLIELGNIE